MREPAAALAPPVVAAAAALRVAPAELAPAVAEEAGDAAVAAALHRPPVQDAANRTQRGFDSLRGRTYDECRAWLEARGERGLLEDYLAFGIVRPLGTCGCSDEAPVLRAGSRASAASCILKLFPSLSLTH